MTVNMGKSGWGSLNQSLNNFSEGKNSMGVLNILRRGVVTLGTTLNFSPIELNLILMVFGN